MTDATEQGVKNEVYDRLHATADFRELRSRYRGFAFPWTIAFLSWYLLYVIMSNWAHDFMSIKLVGHINVALAFGVLQFVSTFWLARHYSKHAEKNLDPLSEKLRAQYERDIPDAAPDRPGDHTRGASA